MPNDHNNSSGATLNVRQAAEYLGWSEKSVRSHVARQTLPYRKMGYRILFIRSELEKFVENLPGTTMEVAITNVEKRQIL